MKSIRSIANRFCITLAAILLVVGGFISNAAPAAAATVTVKMGADNGLLAFVPAKVAVKPGDTVEWVINKVPPHNVVFDAATIPGGDKAFAKSLSHKKLEMAAGDTIKVVIPADAPAGEYNYYCEPHRGAGMAGKIVVGG
jgi:plastocyanin